MNQNEEPQRLPPGQQLVRPEKWPYVGEREPAATDQPWSLCITGLVETPLRFSLEELAGLPQTKMITDIHCVTRWSKFDAEFSGVSLATLLDLCGVKDAARYVSFVARSERRHSSSLKLQEAVSLDCLMATRFNGMPLPKDHGGPLRSVVPRKYFYKSVKWVEQIELLELDRAGHWESESGYHNNADPWKQERYIASSVSKRDAAGLILTKDFSNQELLGIDVSSLDLHGLHAVDALLRNANFSGSQLVSADFRGSNLTNANFRKANLNNATFKNADLEGADFSSADLRGANLSGCSLFGTTFCDASHDSIDNAAKMDGTTRFDPKSLFRLTEHQRQFVERAISESDS